MAGYRLTREQLLLDLYIAFYDARRHKASKSYVIRFEKNLKENLEQLCDDLYYGRYRAQPSKCFIITSPKKREVYAAQFRDRIVHHLYYNYTHVLFERTFIQDTYSCIPGRGTHYGVNRLRQHIRRESHNWTQPCYAMNLDIRGYFMHIIRARMLEIATESIIRMADHQVTHGQSARWRDVIDVDFVLWLTEQIVMLDPQVNCEIVGSLDDWLGMDKSKCLRYAPDGCGLPIGNLTSQLFSNVYMNVFDQWMKREMRCRHYGRYVDDSNVVDSSREWLLSIVPDIRDFLMAELGLELHMGKLHIQEVKQGVQFLGAFVKPYRDYVSHKTLQRIERGMKAIDLRNPEKAMQTVNSYMGVLKHAASYHLQRDLFGLLPFTEAV